MVVMTSWKYWSMNIKQMSMQFQVTSHSDTLIHKNKVLISVPELNGGYEATALHLATVTQEMNCIRTLIELGADQNIECKFSDDFNGTPKVYFIS